MKQLKILLILLIMAGMHTVSPAQELLTLDDAIAIALQKNHQIRILRNTQEISANLAHPGTAGFLPQVNLNSGVNYSEGTSQTSFGTFTQKATVSSAQIEASYNLFEGLGGYYTYKKLKSQSESSALSARNGIESTIVQIASAYFATAAASDGLTIAREGLAISYERLARAKKRASYGQANALDILNAEVDLSADSISFLNMQQRLDEARKNLNVLLDREPDVLFSIESRVRLGTVDSEDALLKHALQHNAAYLLAKAELNSAEYELDKSWASHLPRIDLRGAYGYNQYERDLKVKWDDPQKNISAGLSLSLNLFDGFRRSTQTQNAKIGVRNKAILLNQEKLNLKKNVSVAYSDYLNTLEVLKVNQKRVFSAELNFKRTKEWFNLGRLTNTQFRQAQLNLLLAKNNLAQAKYNAKLSEIRLTQLSGLLLTLK